MKELSKEDQQKQLERLIAEGMNEAKNIQDALMTTETKNIDTVIALHKKVVEISNAVQWLHLVKQANFPSKIVSPNRTAQA